MTAIVIPNGKEAIFTVEPAKEQANTVILSLHKDNSIFSKLKSYQIVKILRNNGKKLLVCNNINKIVSDCSICHKPCSKPITLQNCNHTSCKVCIETWSKFDWSCPCSGYIYKDDTLTVFNFKPLLHLNYKVIDVAALSNVHTLDINCIINVAALGNVHT